MSASATHPPRKSKAWAFLTWPLRRFRWLWIPGLYFGLCWLFIEAATLPPGKVALPPLVKGMHKVWVLGYGYHTAIYIEQPKGWKLGPPGDEEARFVEFGWGDKGWFYDSDMSLASGANAILLPSKTVYYVAGYSKPPTESWPNLPLVQREVSGEELLALVNVLEQSARRTPEGGRMEPYPATPEYDGRFYPGREFYIFWHSCNHWTIETLESAGQEVSSFGVITQKQAFGRLRDWKVLVAPEP